MFLHEAVAETVYLGVKPIKTKDFDAVYKSLLTANKIGERSGLEEQFRVRNLYFAIKSVNATIWFPVYLFGIFAPTKYCTCDILRYICFYTEEKQTVSHRK